MSGDLLECRRDRERANAHLPLTHSLDSSKEQAGMKHTCETSGCAEKDKTCTKCGEGKPLTEFHRAARYTDGHRQQCKTCRTADKAEAWERATEHVCENSGCDQEIKACTGCGDRKPLIAFHRNRVRTDGHNPRCKSCVRAEGEAWRTANPERKSASDRAWRLANPERAAANGKAWRDANKERKAATGRAYYEKNREKILARNRAWAEANKEKVADYLKNRHQEKWANDPEYRSMMYQATLKRQRLLRGARHELYVREEIFERDGWACQICGELIDPDTSWPNSESASIDHIIPISLGGDDTPENVQAAHLSCNVRKGNRDIEDLRSA